MPIIINGNNTPTAGAVGYGNGTELAFNAAGTNGQVLTSAGAGAPTWASPGTVAVTSISFGTTGLTPATATQGAVTVAGTLAVANGGTGLNALGTGITTWLATPSSANLAAAVTDETGSGALVFATSPTLATPTITTSATVPLVIGGTGTTSTLTLRSTSGVGTTGADIIFQAGNNGATETMRVLNSGNLGIGTTSPGTKLHVQGNAWFLSGASNTSNAIGVGRTVVELTNGVAGSAGAFSADAAAGDAIIRTELTGAKLLLQNGSGASAIAISGNNVGIGGTPISGARLSIGNAAFTSTATPERISLGATYSSTAGANPKIALFDIGAAASLYGFGVSNGQLDYMVPPAANHVWYNNGIEQMRLNTSGNLGIGNSSPGVKLDVTGDIRASASILSTGTAGVGYGTGSGGAVTQTTSRTTGVTLDKTNGAITLVSAAGTSTWQTFTVTNSTVAATDTIIVNQKSGTDQYLITVTNVSAGSFKIAYATLAGSTTEQPVFNFAVIKAVTA